MSKGWRKFWQAVVVAAILTAGTVVVAVVNDDDDSRLSANTQTTVVRTTVAQPTTTTGPDAAQACQALITALRGERDKVNALADHMRAKGDHVIGRDSGFESAYAAARDGQAALADAYDDYAATDKPLPPDNETVPYGEPVQVLGRSLADLKSSSAGDVDDAYNALPDWAAKLDNTVREVRKACA